MSNQIYHVGDDIFFVVPTELEKSINIKTGSPLMVRRGKVVTINPSGPDTLMVQVNPEYAQAINVFDVIGVAFRKNIFE